MSKTKTDQAPPPLPAMLVSLIFLLCAVIGTALLLMLANEARGVSWDLSTALSQLQPQCTSLTGQCPAYARRPILANSSRISTPLFDKPRAVLLGAYPSDANIDSSTIPAFVVDGVVNESDIEKLLQLGISTAHNCHDDFIEVVDRVADRMVELTGFEGRYFAEGLRVMYLNDLISEAPVPPSPNEPSRPEGNFQTEGRPGFHAGSPSDSHHKYPIMEAFRRVATVVMFLNSSSKGEDDLAITVGGGAAATASVKAGRALVAFGVHPLTEIVDERAWIRGVQHVGEESKVIVAVAHVRQVSWLDTLKRVQEMTAIGVHVPYARNYKTERGDDMGEEYGDEDGDEDYDEEEDGDEGDGGDEDDDDEGDDDEEFDDDDEYEYEMDKKFEDFDDEEDRTDYTEKVGEGGGKGDDKEYDGDEEDGDEEDGDEEDGDEEDGDEEDDDEEEDDEEEDEEDEDEEGAEWNGGAKRDE